MCCKACLVAEDMIENYLQDDTLDKSRPPIPVTLQEETVMKIVKFVSSSDKIRTSPNWTEVDSLTKFSTNGCAATDTLITFLCY
jgi:hypothetical protein